MSDPTHIRILRKSKLSDTRIGEILGVPRETVNRWRNRKRNPSYSHASHIENSAKKLAKRK